MSTPATAAPTSGPIQYTYQLSKKDAGSAVPNHRAGFIAAPVSGPPSRMSVMTVRPMPKPAIGGASGDTAVPYTAHTRNTVSTASTTTATVGVTPAASAGVPRCVLSI